VVNGGISVWTLVNAYERASGAGSVPADAFADGALAIPENANGVPDLSGRGALGDGLPAGHAGSRGARPCRSRWGAKAGSPGKLALTAIDASGMAHQKIADQLLDGPADRAHRR
jgi:endoglucanase